MITLRPVLVLDSALVNGQWFSKTTERLLVTETMKVGYKEEVEVLRADEAEFGYRMERCEFVVVLQRRRGCCRDDLARRRDVYFPVDQRDCLFTCNVGCL